MTELTLTVRTDFGFGLLSTDAVWPNAGNATATLAEIVISTSARRRLMTPPHRVSSS
jgi:hypothetical protein